MAERLTDLGREKVGDRLREVEEAKKKADRLLSEAKEDERLEDALDALQDAAYRARGEYGRHTIGGKAL